MFTGLIEDLGQVEKIGKNFLSVRTKIKDISLCESLAVNGVCLTVKKIKQFLDFHIYELDVMSETYRVTNIKNLKIFDRVNLERATLASSRLDGHIVQGHVEFVSRVKRIIKNNISHIFVFEAKNENLKNIVYKGSIAIDGISLTVLDVSKNSFSVSVLPETFKKTNLCFKKISDLCNIETDILTRNILNKFNNKEDQNFLKISSLRSY